MENIIVCCLKKYLEVSGIKDVLPEKKIIGPNVVNSVVEGSSDLQKLQIVAIFKHNDTENLKELRNKKVSLENSSDIRNHMCNIERVYDKVHSF